jgi:citrate synthase
VLEAVEVTRGKESFRSEKLESSAFGRGFLGVAERGVADEIFDATRVRARGSPRCDLAAAKGDPPGAPGTCLLGSSADRRMPVTEKAEIKVGDQTFEAPILVGTEQERAIDISALRAKTKYVTIDPASMNTASTKSAITFIDGDKGILRYRGIPIEQLAEKSTFVEVAYLLIHGELPTEAQLADFSKSLVDHALIPENSKNLFDGFNAAAHPMAILSAMVLSLSSYYPDTVDISNREAVNLTIARLIAKLPTIAAFTYKKSIGQPFVYPTSGFKYCGNFLNMMFRSPTNDYHVDPELERVMNLLFILHADHEQNCSTSTVRLVGSSEANLFASVSAGICALWGPLHGGANQEVVEMLDVIHKDGNDVSKYIGLAKDKKSDFLLMGFGHRVYKNFDPRAQILKAAADTVLRKLKINDPLLEVAMRLEEAALKDSYFVERKLYPNVDFYSGIIYRAMGFPTNMFTVLFALGRLPGWIAHWKEMVEDPTTKIGRPRQIYTGLKLRDYVPFEKRGGSPTA